MLSASAGDIGSVLSRSAFKKTQNFAGGCPASVLKSPAMRARVVRVFANARGVWNASEREAKEEKLDEEIGVSGGDLGVECLEHPASKRGTYSAAAMGIGGSGDETLAEGPILPPPK